MSLPAIPAKPTRDRVLIVDDTPANLDLLNQTLEPLGYDIAVATTGEAAIRVAALAKPDLILLDIVMPGLDGFATCQRLKEHPATADIPIIFYQCAKSKRSAGARFCRRCGRLHHQAFQSRRSAITGWNALEDHAPHAGAARTK